MNKRILYRNASWQTLYQILANGLGFVFSIVLARSLSQFEFGAYSYIISLLTIANLFLELGLPTHFWRKWSTDVSTVASDFQAFIGTRIAIAIPISLFLFFYVFVIDRFVSLEFLLGYIYFLLDVFTQPSRIFFTSQNTYQKSVLIDASERIVSLVLAIVLLFSTHSLRLVFVSFIVGRLISILISSRVNPLVTFPFASFKHTFTIIRSALPLFFIGLFSTLYFRIDMMIIRYLLGISQVGIYSAAYRLLDASALLPGILTTAALPTMTLLFEQGQREKLQRLFEILIVYLSVVSLFISMAGTLYAREVILLMYGPAFQASIPLLQLLGWNSVLLFATYPITHFLIANHQEHFYMKALLGLTALNIALNIFLIPHFGLIGAAVATLLCEAISLCVLLPRTKMLLPLRPFLQMLLCAGIAFITVAFLPTPWYINVIILGTIYGTLLLLLKTIKPSDLLPGKKLQPSL